MSTMSVSVLVSHRRANRTSEVSRLRRNSGLKYSQIRKQRFYNVSKDAASRAFGTQRAYPSSLQRVSLPVLFELTASSHSFLVNALHICL